MGSIGNFSTSVRQRLRHLSFFMLDRLEHREWKNVEASSTSSLSGRSLDSKASNTRPLSSTSSTDSSRIRESFGCWRRLERFLTCLAEIRICSTFGITGNRPQSSMIGASRCQGSKGSNNIRSNFVAVSSSVSLRRCSGLRVRQVQ